MFADMDPILVAQLAINHPTVIDEGTVGAPQVGQKEAFVVLSDPGVSAGDGRMINHDLAVGIAADDQFAAGCDHIVAEDFVSKGKNESGHTLPPVLSGCKDQDLMVNDGGLFCDAAMRFGSGRIKSMANQFYQFYQSYQSPGSVCRNLSFVFI
jgi:hypothetical protein